MSSVHAPLEDIGNTRRIERVYFNGYSMDEEQISGILAAVAAANDRGRSVDIAPYVD